MQSRCTRCTGLQGRILGTRVHGRKPGGSGSDARHARWVPTHLASQMISATCIHVQRRQRCPRPRPALTWPCAAHRRRKRPPCCCCSHTRTHRAVTMSGGRRWRSFQEGTCLQRRWPGCEVVVMEDGRPPRTMSTGTTRPYVLAASHQASCRQLVLQ